MVSHEFPPELLDLIETHYRELIKIQRGSPKWLELKKEYEVLVESLKKKYPGYFIDNPAEVAQRFSKAEEGGIIPRIIIAPQGFVFAICASWEGWKELDRFHDQDVHATWRILAYASYCRFILELEWVSIDQQLKLIFNPYEHLEALKRLRNKAPLAIAESLTTPALNLSVDLHSNTVLPQIDVWERINRVSIEFHQQN